MKNIHLVEHSERLVDKLCDRDDIYCEKDVNNQLEPRLCSAVRELSLADTAHHLVSLLGLMAKIKV